MQHRRFRSVRSKFSGWYRARRGPGALLGLAAVALALGLGGVPRARADAGEGGRGAAGARARDVVLVHGAWVDGSSWADVIERLQRDGYTVRAVAGLVFAAAYALDDGESLGALNARFPATPILPALVFDAQGSATVDPEAFTRIFAPDLPVHRARVLAAVQKPISGAIFGTPGGHPAWRDVPSWYQVSADDQVISPELERFVAARMGARTIELSSSHASPLSHSHAIAELIEQASRGQ